MSDENGRGTRPRLVMISGPIAAGKSTLAAERVRMLRQQDLSVAPTDLDTVAEMALPTLPSWPARQRGRAGLHDQSATQPHRAGAGRPSPTLSG